MFGNEKRISAFTNLDKINWRKTSINVVVGRVRILSEFIKTDLIVMSHSWSKEK